MGIERIFKAACKWVPVLTLVSLLASPGLIAEGQVVLQKDNFRIVTSELEQGPLKLAILALKKDFVAVLGADPQLDHRMDKESSATEIVIINLASGHMQVPGNQLRELDGYESHRVYADSESNRIYLLGNDLRGTIYAIYTFADEVLGVPPLKYWCSWEPEEKEKINIASDLDIFYRSPQVRYRSLLPGDQDFFTPWRKLSEENDNIWLETALRLKINTIETYSTILPEYKLTDYAYLIDKYGLVITSHHTSGLNTSFRTWGDYWREMRDRDAPEYLLSNEEAILDFFTYNAETVKRSGIENLWTVAFRGERDQPYWSIFEDAPEDEKERAEVINRMLQIQYDLVKEMTGDKEPYARITFYDELAILMAKGYLKPPVSKNMIWTFVAGRRDHYPYDDIVNFNASEDVKLGYYMNFGFASTGAHVAPAESPWKMEFNYRYVNDKAPLYFSVVNVGNFREFVLELSANAKLLWDYNSYDTDKFMIDYCSQYFGDKHAEEIAALYKAFYNAYWIPKASEFEGLDRQFVFQDLRYARAFDHIFDEFYTTGDEINMNPLHKIGYESVPGRTFRIDNNHNNAENQVDALLNGMQLTIPKFEMVAAKCSEMMFKLDKDSQTFFNDNLRIFSYYMAHLSKALYHYVYAYKHQPDKEILIKHLNLAYQEASRAQNYLLEAQHGVFSTWYTNADPLTRTFQIDTLKSNILLLKEKAQSRQNIQPNVLIIVTDDMGYGDVSCYDDHAASTPHIDKLASEGVLCTDFYVPTPYCAPSRATILTGRFPLRHGVIRNPAPDAGINDIGIADDEVLLGEVFQKEGYSTKLIGKWHLGHKEEFFPVKHGFDEYYGILYSNDMRPVQIIENMDTLEYPVDQAYLTQKYTKEAIHFIRENAGTPFFLHLCHAMPHKPLAASSEFYTPDTREDLYHDVIRELDWSTGQIYQTLKDQGILENTIIIFMSDNGGSYGANNGPLKGRKHTNWEGGVRVPFIIRYPEKLPSGSVENTPCWSPDIFPTILTMTDIPIPEGLILDGEEIIDVLNGERQTHTPIFTMQGDEIKSVRKGDWKLFLKRPKFYKAVDLENWSDWRAPDGTTIIAPFEQADPSMYPGIKPEKMEGNIFLFNLKEDISEMTNRSETQQEIIRELENELSGFEGSLNN